jgi:hypothetical protein
VKDFYASQWIAMTSSVQVFVSVSAGSKAEITPQQRIEALDELRRMQEFCRDGGLDVSGIMAEMVEENFRTETRHEYVGNKLLELLQRMHDELSLRLVFQIPIAKAKYYKEKELFSAAVSLAFPSAIVDIEEAGKCFALGRNTACVFHLMRVMEVGLHVLGETLGDPIDAKTNPTWERILHKCDEELKKNYADRCSQWKAKGQFFSEATANLRAVKDAWRNPTLHVDISYDEDKAFDVWNAVRGFMKHLATELNETLEL